MYKAIIEAHNLRKIEPEPIYIQTLKAISLPELTEQTAVLVCGENPLIRNGFAISANYTWENE